MINIRKDLIQADLKESATEGLYFKPLKLSNQFIDWLFNHYYCHEFCEFFYDTEPDYDSLEFNQYMTYSSILNGVPHNYCDKEYPLSELKQSYANILQQRRDYESRRIEYNNWIEPYFEGNWSYTQKYVNQIARDALKDEIKKCSLPLKDRLYWAKQNDYIRIYFYGRDFQEVDYWFIFRKRNKRKK